VDWLIAIADTTNPPLVNSMSYGSNEEFETADVKNNFNTQAQNLGIQGVTLLISSGDGGVSGEECCPLQNNGYVPSFPATSPYVTAVGATMGNSGYAPTSLSDEIASMARSSGM